LAGTAAPALGGAGQRKLLIDNEFRAGANSARYPVWFLLI
jgi:hypothetical protein